ncbi:pro-neuregulin-3, membrane-bound isoform isoform X3 [Rhinatrema bivittatum]|uniref:pro-neuregulin-3, membrane-bound isoform isoform X3 n=1 Tax=Rhinatrema bivittatum TaxID=194408 RepID=UPI001128F6F1|nr:pro-neuregulin-3, membrane-bound isoform isoform X3 [Rhinatrema bivittatum]
MSEGAASTSPPVRPAAADEAAGGNSTEEQDGAPNPREVRCSDCIVWNRQQTWLCVVPLLIGFIGLGLSLMLLKWIVVGSVKDYVPTDLMDSKGIGQDPFFLSKPSSYPKNMETTTTTTTTRTPNQISTRLTTTTRAPVRIPGARIPIRTSPRTTTVRHSAAPPTIISTTVPFSSTTFVARPHLGTPTTQPMPTWPTAAYSTSSYKIYLHDSAPSWTLSRFQESTTTPETITIPRFHTTTYSTERSEHFKPCKDKDLSYCLNDGECFVIETLTGSHKHCRCKEGYQGVRCDQFLPKTDSILSDPNHLGIEFMESEEVYQKQVLSISCIIFGIIIVGIICTAFYFRTRKQNKKIQEQLKETRNGKHYSLNASSMMEKSNTMAQNRIQMQKYSNSERHPEPIMENIMESSCSGNQPFSEAPLSDRGSQPIKHHSRSLSPYCSSGQRSGMLYRNAFQRTPPLSRGRLSGIMGPAYQQLEEPRSTDHNTPCQGHSASDLKNAQNTSINMQLPSRETKPYFNNLNQKDLIGYSSARASSVPIIPSVGLDDACMQMQNISEVPGIKQCKSSSYSAELVHVSTPANNCLIAEQQEVKILLETVQEQIRILTDGRRQSEDYELANADAEDSASENTAFLPLSPMAKSEREAQFVLKNETLRDSTFSK